MNAAILYALERTCDNGVRSNIDLAETRLAHNEDAAHYIGKATAYMEISKIIETIIEDLKTE